MKRACSSVRARRVRTCSSSYLESNEGNADVLEVTLVSNANDTAPEEADASRTRRRASARDGGPHPVDRRSELGVWKLVARAIPTRLLSDVAAPPPAAPHVPGAQLPFDLVEPIRVRLDDPPSEAVVEEEVALPVRNGRRHRLGDIEPCGVVGDVVTKAAERFQRRVLTDEVGSEQPPRRLHLDARKAARLVHPRAQRLVPSLGERVVGPFARPPWLLA